MAAGNQLVVTLSFKPVMDGLNRFVAAYQTRMQQVQAFQQRIQNGEAAVQRALSQVGLVLGAAALNKYAREAREADKVQQQLIRTLERTGQSGALAALNAQAAALQKLTLFGDESINSVQRLLISFGLTADQALAMTEAVLDFAQETGQSAESAAMLIGRTLAGDSEELGRYKIQLDQTKGKVDALTEALRKFAAGSAQGAVADPRARGIEARFADATENLGRAVNNTVVPFLEALIPLLERVTTAATTLAVQLAGIAPLMGDMAAAVLPGVLAVGLLSAGLKVLMMVINPLRVAIAYLAGRSLLELNNALAQSTGGAAGLWTTLKNGGGVLAGLGSALAYVGSIAAAAFAGWQLGKLINEIEVGGLKVKDWAAIVLLYVKDKIGGAFSSLQEIWVRLRGAWDSFQLHVRSTALQMAISVAEAWNKLPVSKKIDTSEWQLAVGRMTAEIAGLDARTKGELDAIAQRRIAAMLDTAGTIAFIKQGAGQGAGNGAGTGATAAGGRPDLNAGKFGETDATRKAAMDLALKRELFALETQAIQAEAAGNTKLAQQFREQIKMREYQAQLENDKLGLAKQRIDAERALTAAERARQVQEQQFSQRIGALQLEREQIENNRFLTTEEKQKRIVELLRQQNEQIAQRIANLEREQVLSPDPARQQTIDSLRMDQGKNAGEIEATRPLTMAESLQAAIVSIQSAVGSLAEQVSSTFSAVGESIRTSLGGAFADMILKASSFKDAAVGFAQSVGTAFVSSTAQMVADWIYSHVIMEGVRSAFHALGITEKAAATTTEVGIHAAGETAKTGASLAGSISRKGIILAETIFHGVQVGFRVVASIAGEALMTAKALAGFALRLPKIVIETGAYVAQAAAKALSALASIPYVGPVLAIAAMIAILNAGSKLVSSFATGGLVEGPGTGTSDSVMARLSNGEYVNTAATVSRFGPEFFAGLEDGVINLPGNVTAGMASPNYDAMSAPTGGGGATDMAALVRAVAEKIRLTVISPPDQRAATQIDRRSRAAGDIVAIVKSHRSEIFRHGP